MIVIGCGKAKREGRQKARELYTGSLFVMSRKYAERCAALTGEPWAILSAAYGLVLPDDELDSYDQRLELRGAALAEWAERAACRCMKLRRQSNELVECLAGQRYAWPFRNALDQLGVMTALPLAGKGTGHRLQWMSSRLQCLGWEAAS